MSYTPKHAKPASAKDVARSTYHGAFGTAEAAPGRHARHGNGQAQRATGTAQARDSVTSKAA
jgi:hypothetical protein